MVSVAFHDLEDAKDAPDEHLQEAIDHLRYASTIVSMAEPVHTASNTESSGVAHDCGCEGTFGNVDRPGSLSQAVDLTATHLKSLAGVDDDYTMRASRLILFPPIALAGTMCHPDATVASVSQTYLCGWVLTIWFCRAHVPFVQPEGFGTQHGEALMLISYCPTSSSSNPDAEVLNSDDGSASTEDSTESDVQEASQSGITGKS